MGDLVKTAPASGATVRGTTTLPKETYRRLKSIAARRGVSLTRVLTDAIEREHYVDTVMVNGGKILSQDRDGTLYYIELDDS